VILNCPPALKKYLAASELLKVTENAKVAEVCHVPETVPVVPA
jgi:hypothetical protein